VLPIGIGADRADVVNADLGSDRAVAIAGSGRFRSGLVRTLLVEATTLHGPADLDLVVLTNPDRLALWDWAKWLPHLRLDGRPAIWSSLHDITSWTEGIDRRAVPTAAPWMPSHLTMVILDDPGLWNRRDSPLQSIVSNPPADLRLIALCDDATQAPAVCTTVISEDDDGLARVHSFTRTNDAGAVRAALTEAAVAVQVARALAPLADVELPTPAAPATRSVDLIDLGELISADEPAHVLARWAKNAPRPAVAIGRRGDDFVAVPVTDDVTVVVASSMGDAFDVAATSLIAQCVERSPDAMWIVPLTLEPTSRSELLWKLPHATDPPDVNTTIEPQRLLARLRTVLAEPDGPDRIVLVAEAPSASTASSDDTWLVALARGVRATSGLAMVVATDRSDMANLLGDTVIRIEQHGDSRADAHRVASVTARDGTTGQPFTPLQRSPAPIADLELRAYVVGRAFTPLERRIEQRRTQTGERPDRSLVAAVTMLRDAASRNRGDETPDVARMRAVMPSPMPTRVDLNELLANSPGDGVPLGLVDDPNTAGVRTRWWEPGNGSLLVFGSRRSGVEQTLATIVLGIIDRFSTLDVRLVVVERSSTRRRALNGTDHAMRIVTPDHTDEVLDAIDEIATELDRSALTNHAARPDGPRMVVMIGDLVHLRRRYADQPLGARIDQVLTTAARTGSGVDVIAYAAELDGAGPFATTATSRLVGASSDHDELLALGVEHPSDLEGVVGRCRSFPGSDLVQLAMPDAATETLLARRSIGGNQ
jgi:S-DNA-T family DNA segregation ATPase FtsK/SpoIIIE